MALEAGTRLGAYAIVSHIGAGGMGEVYRATDTRLDRSVAIKILPAAFANDAQFRQRFDREARMISQLNHPHICSLFDVGQDETSRDQVTNGIQEVDGSIPFGSTNRPSTSLLRRGTAI